MDQYDQMIKYARALQLGTAEAEQILRRFSGRGPKHPTLAAIEELGRAVRTAGWSRGGTPAGRDAQPATRPAAASRPAATSRRRRVCTGPGYPPRGR